MRPEDTSKKTKKKRKRREFTDEYKAEVVRLCQQPGKNPNAFTYICLPKTECALAIFNSPVRITDPEYIQRAIAT
jgi:hypothetical protein